MSAVFDLEQIQAELESEDWEDDDGNDMQRRSVYLGTVFSLCPSGKYYTPWANSNVTEDEANQDEAWYEQAEAELDSIGCSLESGEGDPCDLYAVEYRDSPEEDEEDEEAA